MSGKKGTPHEVGAELANDIAEKIDRIDNLGLKLLKPGLVGSAYILAAGARFTENVTGIDAVMSGFKADEPKAPGKTPSVPSEVKSRDRH